MGAINIDNTGSGGGITLSSDGTSLLLGGTAVGGSALELYAENPSSPTTPIATGANDVAIGTQAEATGGAAIALGYDAVASGNLSLAINAATASNTASIAIGQQAVASGSSSLALGYGTDATGGFSTAVGRNAQATSTSANAFGRDAVSAGNQSTAIGDAYASGTDSFAAAIANNTSSYGATGSNSIAMGYLSKSTGQGSFSAGYQNTSQGFASAAIGSSNSITAAGSSSVALGYNNTVSGGYASALGGHSNSVTAGYAVATGYRAKADIHGKVAHSAGYFSSVGDAQNGKFVLRSDTTDATPEALTGDNFSGTTQIILPNNSAYSFSGTIIARESATDGSDYASWEIKGALLRDANAASTVLGNGIVNKLYATSGASAWAVALTADTTNGGLKVEVTGAAATNSRWVATVNTSEVTYA